MWNRLVKAFMLAALVLGLLMGPRVASKAASSGGGLMTPSALDGGGSNSH